MCVICKHDYNTKTAIINCDSCARVTRLPPPESVPNLQVLICNNTRIKIVPDYPKLINLKCDYTNVMKLPNCPKLKSYTCMYTNISSLPYYYKLEILHEETNLEITNLPAILDMQKRIAIGINLPDELMDFIQNL